MSTQQHVSSTTVNKICAFLKYCIEKGIKKHQLDERFNLNNLSKLGICHCFIGFLYWLQHLFLNYIHVFSIFVITRVRYAKLITTTLIHKEL